MKKITIYSKGENNIERFNVFIYEKYLLKILKELDNYYGIQEKVEEYYGPFFPKTEDGEFYEPICSKLINSDGDNNLYMHTVRYIKTFGLSKIVRELLNGNYLKASIAINELYNYNSKTEEEKEFLEEVKSCFHFEKNDKKIDLRKLLLEFERSLLEDDISIKFIDDKTAAKTDSIPYSYVFNKKHE